MDRLRGQFISTGDLEPATNGPRLANLDILQDFRRGKQRPEYRNRPAMIINNRPGPATLTGINDTGPGCRDPAKVCLGHVNAVLGISLESLFERDHLTDPFNAPVEWDYPTGLG